MPKTQSVGAVMTINRTIPPPWRPPAGPTLVQIHDFGSYQKLSVDEHRVPYIEMSDVTDKWKGFDPEGNDVTDEARRLANAVLAGERVFNLTLDDRFGQTATESELHNWGWFLANAMAVSGGYTSHGQNSRRINRHGVSR
jgi:hypothetical protein